MHLLRVKPKLMEDIMIEIKRLLVCYLIGAVFILPSCSLFVGSTQPLTITATDPNAVISVDGLPLGNGTVTTEVKRNRSHSIMAKTADGRAGSAHVGTQISTTCVLDIVGGLFLLVPFLGVVSPGFWSIDQEQVVVVVPPPPPSTGNK